MLNSVSTVSGKVSLVLYCDAAYLENSEGIMEITKDTKVYDILEKYGDIADVMETFGVRRVGPFSLRRVITRFISVERAARIHKVPLDDMLSSLKKATEKAT